MFTLGLLCNDLALFLSACGRSCMCVCMCVFVCCDSVFPLNVTHNWIVPPEYATTRDGGVKRDCSELGKGIVA